MPNGRRSRFSGSPNSASMKNPLGPTMTVDYSKVPGAAGYEISVHRIQVSAKVPRSDGKLQPGERQLTGS